jgi:hypothetical protein
VYFPGVKAARAAVIESGNLNFLEPSGPLQAYNGTALLLPLPFIRSLNGLVSERGLAVPTLAASLLLC